MGEDSDDEFRRKIREGIVIEIERR